MTKLSYANFALDYDSKNTDSEGGGWLKNFQDNSFDKTFRVRDWEVWQIEFEEEKKLKKEDSQERN